MGANDLLLLLLRLTTHLLIRKKNARTKFKHLMRYRKSQDLAIHRNRTKVLLNGDYITVVKSYLLPLLIGAR